MLTMSRNGECEFDNKYVRYMYNSDMLNTTLKMKIGYNLFEIHKLDMIELINNVAFYMRNIQYYISR